MSRREKKKNAVPTRLGAGAGLCVSTTLPFCLALCVPFARFAFGLSPFARPKRARAARARVRTWLSVLALITDLR